MARGGTGKGTSVLALDSFNDTVTSGSSVVVYADPSQRHLAREAAQQAYEQGAGWVEVVYATGADNAYSGERAGAYDHALRLGEIDGPLQHVWDEHTRERYAAALMHNALRIKPGDKLVIDALPEHAPVVEKVVAQAYLSGAVTVDVVYDDPHLDVVRATATEGEFVKAPEDWKRERIDAAMADGACYLAIQDNEQAGLVDAAHRQRQAAERATRRFDTHDAYYDLQRSNNVRWCIAQAPTQRWADRVYPELAGPAAQHQLGQDLLEFAYCSVDDEPDAYAQHLARLNSRAAWLNEQKIERLVFTGDDGRELSMGLLEGSRFLPCDWDTATGESFACNVPSSEIFTSPDPATVSGRVRTTRPVMMSGYQVEEFELEFVDGKASLVSCTPANYARVVEAHLRADAGSSSLGEVGLVAESRAGDKNRLYYSDIIDENSCSHVALGYGYDAALDPNAESQGTNNQSGFHFDLMVAGSSSSVKIEGLTQDGRRISIIDGNAWQGEG